MGEFDIFEEKNHFAVLLVQHGRGAHHLARLGSSDHSGPGLEEAARLRADHIYVRHFFLHYLGSEGHSPKEEINLGWKNNHTELSFKGFYKCFERLVTAIASRVGISHKKYTIS